MSDIRDLYANIADMSVAFTDTESNARAITARDLHEIKDNEIGALPVRVVIPFKERGSGGSDLTLLTVGVSDVFGEMVWRIADLMLWKEAGEGYGIEKIIPDLILYCGAYIEKLADAGRDQGLGTMTFAGLTLDAAVIEFPIDSGQLFYGVEAVLTYQELINP